MTLATTTHIEAVDHDTLVLSGGRTLSLRADAADVHGWELVTTRAGRLASVIVDAGDALVPAADGARAEVRAALAAVVAQHHAALSNGASSSHLHTFAPRARRLDETHHELVVVTAPPTPAWPGARDPLLADAVRSVCAAVPALELRVHGGGLPVFFAHATLQGIAHDEPLTVTWQGHSVGTAAVASEDLADVVSDVVASAVAAVVPDAAPAFAQDVRVCFAHTRLRFDRCPPADVLAALVREIVDERLVVARAADRAWWCRPGAAGSVGPVVQEAVPIVWRPFAPELRSWRGTYDRNLTPGEVEALVHTARSGAVHRVSLTPPGRVLRRLLAQRYH